MHRAGFTGKGVGVALIDTGVTEVPGLDTGNVYHGPDLSFDSQDPELTHKDAYGHGTHLASIIAGRDAVGTRPPTPTRPLLGRRAGREPGQRQGRRPGRCGRRVPGDRRARLGRGAPQRQRPEHQGHRPCLRDRLDAGPWRRPARLRRRAGLEGRHHGGRRGRQRRTRHDAPGEPGSEPVRAGRGSRRHPGPPSTTGTTRCPRGPPAAPTPGMSTSWRPGSR